MTALITTIFIASLAGSLHCAGMCGAFMLFAVGSPGGGSQRTWHLHAAYHLGRLVVYVTFGVIAGLAGATLELGGQLMGVQRGAMIAAALFMVTMGVLMLVRTRGVSLPRMPVPGALRTVAARGYKLLGDRTPVVRALGTGLLTTVLPCGWLYMFVVAAAGTGNPATAALTMAVFWVGTLPVLITLAAGARGALGPLAKRAPALAALAIVAVGMFTLFNRSALIVRTPEMLESLAVSAEAPEAGLADVPPCCRGGS